MRYLFIISFVSISMLFNACSSNSSSRETTRAPGYVAISGTVVDGLITGASVCIDENKNNQCDSGESTSLSLNNGSFSLNFDDRTGGKFKIISKGGVDTATGQNFDARLEEIVNIEINKATPFVIVSPLTTLGVKIYEIQKTIEPTYTTTDAKDKLALKLGLASEQVSINPLDEIIVFAKTQQLIQIAQLATISSKRTFDEVFDQMAITINNDETNATDLNVSQFIQDLETTYSDVNISDEMTTYMQEYSNEVKIKINEASTTNDLVDIQNVIQSYTTQVNNILDDTQNIDKQTTLDGVLTDMKGTDVLDMVDNTQTIVSNNTSTLKPTIFLQTDGYSVDDATPTIYGQAEVGANISIQDSLGAEVISTVVDSNGSYSITLSTLVDGTYNFLAVAKDAVSNVNTSDILEVVVNTSLSIDLNSSSDSGISDVDNITNITTPIILTDTPRTIYVKDSNLTVVQTLTTQDINNISLVELPVLSDGLYTIGIDSTSINGNILNLTIDTSVPVFTSPAENNISISENDLTMPSVSATDNLTVTYSLSGDDSSNFGIDEFSGDIVVTNTADINSILTFNADATDLAGNTSSVVFNVTINKISTINTDKFSSDLSSSDEYFGQSSAVSNEYIVVGASGQYDNTNIEGAVYLYKRGSDNRVVELARITASDGSAGNEFGSSVSIWGKYIVVGARGDNLLGSEAGAAYLFKIQDNDKVSELVKFNASDTDTLDLFGSSVSINNDYIVVGAKWRDKDGINKAGAAYLFQIQDDDSVTELSKFTASDIQLSDFFGTSVSIWDDYIVVGATGEDDLGSDAGAVYMFKKDGVGNVVERAKFVASDINESYMFGNSVSISQDTIVIGISNKNSLDSNSTGAYVFKKNTSDEVLEIAKLTPDNNSTNLFGSSVSIYEDFIAIGAYTEDTNTGAVYLYKQYQDNNVSKIAKLIAPDARADEYFGASVSISKNYIIVGATKGGNKTGSAYIYDIYADGPYLPILDSSVNLFESNILNKYTLTPTFTNSLINISISGDDADKFIIEDNIIKSINILDFQNPIDKGSNNKYSITIKLEDSNNRTNSYDTDIVINDSVYLSEAKLIASDADNNDSFGSSISVDGDYIVVGAPNESNTTGAVYLYKKEIDNSVTEIAKIVSLDIEAGDKFGTSVAISGDYIVVGCENKETAYVFKKDVNGAVIETQKLIASDNEAGDKFSSAVSISGVYIFVGAKGNESAYLYQIAADDSVSELAIIQASDTLTGNNFANSVSIYGDYMTVGSSGNESAYVFKRDADDSISELSKIIASDASANDLFGYSVAISGDFIVVGAIGADAQGDNAGSAYVYRLDINDGVNEIANLNASNAKFNDQFGYSVAISGTNIIVGANTKDEFGNDNGAAYVYEITISNSSVAEVSRLYASDIQDYDFFGSSVAISGDNIVVGANQFKQKNSNTGEVYLFRADDN